MRKLFPLLLALLLPLAACSGEDDPVAPDPNGSLSFTYNGAISGALSVRGEARAGDDYPQNDFAVAQSSGGNVSILAIRPTERPKFDFFGIQLQGITGSRTVQVCPVPSGSSCPVIFLVLGFNGDGDTFDRAFVFLSGSVTISESTAERVRGSFEGTAIAIDPGTGQPILGQTITITNGQFDVPVRNDLSSLLDD